jgi:hypothetical protein
MARDQVSFLDLLAILLGTPDFLLGPSSQLTWTLGFLLGPSSQLTWTLGFLLGPSSHLTWNSGFPSWTF